MTGAAQTAEGPPASLRRSLGPAEVAFLSFSALSPAASVYLYGAGVIRIAGTGAVLALILGGLLAAALGLLYGELGSAHPSAGGLYPSLARVLGPTAAFPYIVLMLMVTPTSVAFQTLGLADYVHVLAPEAPTALVVVGSLALAGVIAALSVRAGAWVTSLFLLLESIALATLAAVSAAHPARSLAGALAHPLVLGPHGLVPVGAVAVALATVSAVYTCGGAGWPLYYAEEMREPRLNIGRVVTVLAPVAAFAIAAPLVLALLSASDLKTVLASPAPIAEVLSAAAGPLTARLVSLGVVLAVFNANVACIIGYSRLLFGTARDGVWPEALARPLLRISAAGAPWGATAAFTLVTALCCALSETLLLVIVANQTLFEYALMALAVLRGRPRGLTGRDHRIPLHPIVPILALIAAGGFIASEVLDPETGRPSLVFVGGLLVLSLVYWRLRLQGRGALSLS